MTIDTEVNEPFDIDRHLRSVSWEHEADIAFVKPYLEAVEQHYPSDTLKKELIDIGAKLITGVMKNNIQLVIDTIYASDYPTRDYNIPVTYCSTSVAPDGEARSTIVRLEIESPGFETEEEASIEIAKKVFDSIVTNIKHGLGTSIIFEDDLFTDTIVVSRPTMDDTFKARILKSIFPKERSYAAVTNILRGIYNAPGFTFVSFNNANEGEQALVNVQDCDNADVRINLLTYAEGESLLGTSLQDGFMVHDTYPNRGIDEAMDTLSVALAADTLSEFEETGKMRQVLEATVSWSVDAVQVHKTGRKGFTVKNGYLELADH